MCVVGPGLLSTRAASLSLRLLQETVNHQPVGKCRYIHLSVGDGGRTKLGVIPDIVPGRYLAAIPKFIGEVGSVEGAHNPVHDVLVGVPRVSTRRPNDRSSGLVAVRGKR